ncbi:MAG TPA: hypothetical protein VFX48_02510, partial [Saprospiraceae bacterium]|nr:hypothetical protein [Saprospiraceae bacterium]
MNGEEAPSEMASLLGNMEMEIYSDGILQKSVMNMMMMRTVTLTDLRVDSVHLYMDLLGKKYHVADSKASALKSADATMKALNENTVIKEYPEDVKEILGYKCHR